MFPDTELPPQPIVTRWGTWIAAAIYYAEHIQQIQAFLDELDENEAESVRKMKRKIKNENLRNDLAFIKCHFSCIPVAIQKLEGKGVLPSDAIETFNSIRTNLQAIRRQKEFMQKFDAVRDKNHGLKLMETIGQILDGDQNNIADDEIKDMTPNEIQAFKYAPITSCDVERSFSAYKRVLEDCRRSFVFENLRKHIILHCNRFEN